MKCKKKLKKQQNGMTKISFRFVVFLISNKDLSKTTRNKVTSFS